jgi:GxxExxY protein
MLYKDETFKIIGAGMEVHKQLGGGFLEPVYQEALAIEFKELNLPFEREVQLPIYYKEHKLTKLYKPDFICFGKIIIELKASAAIVDENYAQVFNYLKASKMKLALLLNFGSKSLEYKRIIF